MFKLNRVHHIAIICSDYKKSKHFYSEILGLKIISEVYREQRNSYKLDLEVGDIDAVINYIKESGVIVEPIRIDEFTGKRFTFFADPDGLPIELYEK